MEMASRPKSSSYYSFAAGLLLQQNRYPLQHDGFFSITNPSPSLPSFLPSSNTFHPSIPENNHSRNDPETI
jgi:hypothetical protein